MIRKCLLIFTTLLLSCILFGCESESPEMLDFTAELVPDQMISDSEDMIIACDQNKGRVVVYDLKNYNSGESIDNYEIWSYRPYADPMTVSGVKYRENTVLGNVVMMVGSGGDAVVVSYPEKKMLWSNSDVGSNPHSIEILPDGNIACASSNGSTVRLYHTSDLQYGGYVSNNDFIEYTLSDAHGVLWDPKYNVLWALGAYELVSYKIEGENMSASLVQTGSYPLPTYWGHDLVADLNDSDYLWVTTGESMYRFNKVSGEFNNQFQSSEILNHHDIKGFGNNRNGNYFYVYPNALAPEVTRVMDSWCSDRLYFAKQTESGIVTEELKSDICDYYKVRIFYGQYQ